MAYTMHDADEFISLMLNAANCKTLYVKGGFGQTLNAKGKERVINAYKYNERRKNKIMALPDDSFAFDCCGSIKGVQWGFIGDPSKIYGGAVYKSNGLDDVTELGLYSLCYDKSTNMGAIQKGELLYMTGHCGLYMGNGKVIEATPAGKDGLQITDLTFQKWSKHGKLPFIMYEQNEKPIVAKPTLRRGSRGTQVNYLQKDLNFLGEHLEVDGIFGEMTDGAVRRFQRSHSDIYGHDLVVDGIYGKNTYNAMMRCLT